MKILYVNPGKIEAGLDSVMKGPPLSLLSIAAMVPEHEATLFDFKVDKYKEKKFRKLLREHEVVAITSMTPQITHALEVADMAKEEGAITVIGGYQPTLDPAGVAAHPSIDYCVRGEGEHTFREIINCIDPSTENANIDSILGLSYHDDDGVVHHNDNRPLESNLDNFPIPRRDLLRGKPYQYMGTRVILMETSRGCPHNCTFCCIIKMWENAEGQSNKLRYRTKSVKRVMEEIYSIYNLKGQKWDFIFFNDDNFSINIKRTRRILNLLVKSKMNKHFYFSCQSRVDTLYNNPTLAAEMAEAGFRQIFLGIESIHQQSLDAMNKHTNENMIRTACKMCRDNKMSIFAGMIIGYPGETAEMVRQNIEFAIDLDPDFVQFTPITAFPGTDFFKQQMKAGKISTLEYKYYNLFTPMMRTDELSRNMMYKLVAEAYAKFYINLQYPKKMLNRILKDKFMWMLKTAFPWTKQFVFGGWGMFRSMGIERHLLQEPEMEVEKTVTTNLRPSKLVLPISSK
ncbi:MAG: radical SAM protein [Candidatus Lokiarchaeota archaeon]|nr:radical SAM protein [Candidatus Lokiarchaeota archaeon]